MTKLAIVFVFCLVTAFIPDRSLKTVMGKSFFAGYMSQVPSISSSGWYTIHFKNGNVETPTKDSVFKLGGFVKVEEGLKVYASAYRRGGWLMQKRKMDFAGKTVYIKWKLNAQYDFADIHAILYPDTEATPDFYKRYTMLVISPPAINGMNQKKYLLRKIGSTPGLFSIKKASLLILQKIIMIIRQAL